MTTSIQQRNTAQPEIHREGLAAIIREEIDSQISTAKRYPRQLTTFLANATALATIDPQTAADCFYRKPVGKNPDTGEMEYADGESIRLAEIVLGTYQNLRAGVRIQDDSDPRKVIVEAVVHDLENNVAVTIPKVQRTTYKNGNPYSDEMRKNMTNAVASIALRDCVFRVVPRAALMPIIKAARQKSLEGGESKLETGVANFRKWAGGLGIGLDRIYAAIGIKEESQLDMDKLRKLAGIRTGIDNGDVTVDAAFPSIEKPAQEAKVGKQQKAKAPVKQDFFQEPEPEAEADDKEKRRQKCLAEIQKLCASRGLTDQEFMQALADKDLDEQGTALPDLSLHTLTIIVNNFGKLFPAS